MPAPFGNKNGIKLKSPDIRQEAYKKYCEWIASGMPRKAWSFKHPEFTCSYRTMDKYIAENPIEFPPLTIEIAECDSYAHWFKKGIAMMEGTVEKCQPAIYQMIMRNMHNWDKEDHSNKQSNETLVEKFLNILDKSDGKRTEEV